ncbi:MAG: hypothetical protein IT332_09660 [Ardenticatenales bacterium]|nr:hypothetical protein [Ardenticatenales bacterium]
MSSPPAANTPDRPDGRRRYHPTDYGERQWQALVAFADGHADAFQCAIPYRIVRLSLPDAPLWPSALERLRPFLIDRFASLVRWGELDDTPAEILTFSLDPAVRRWIDAAGHLAHWAWNRRMPEDPTFLLRGEPLVASDSRTGRVAVFASADEHAEITRERGVRLIEPLGAACEPWPTP